MYTVNPIKPLHICVNIEVSYERVPPMFHKGFYPPVCLFSFPFYDLHLYQLILQQWVAISHPFGPSMLCP